MKALTFSHFGGPEVLTYIDVPNPVLKADEVLVKMEAIGLNYADIYRRKGNYHLKGTAPYIAGYEGAGTIIESSNSTYRVGHRIGFADVPFANAELVSVPVSHLIPLPDDISPELAATALLQGLTAQYLAEDSFHVQPGQTVVIHVAAGGVGQILTQLCKLKGARVIGLTTKKSKLAVIRNVGADIALDLKDEWTSQVLNLTGNMGADVVYDSVGSTLNASLKITKTRGTVVFYGMSGGNPELIDPRVLMDGSKTVTGGDLWSYLNNHNERTRRAGKLFEWIRQGKLSFPAAKRFNLSAGKEAHSYLESGQAIGKVILLPD